MSDYFWGHTPIHDSNRGFDGKCRQFRASLYMRALRLTRNPADAEDLLQASLVKAWIRYETYSQERSFVTWMAAIMLRTFLDRRRAEGRRIQPSSLDVLIGNEEDAPLDRARATRGADSEAELIERLSREELMKAILSLRPTHQRAILLHEVDGLSYEECARIEGVAVGTIRSRLFRARDQMRKTLLAQASGSVSTAT